MKVLKAIFRFLFSRRLWTFIGIVLLCALIWFFGPLVSVGEMVPLEGDLVRMIVIAVILVLWLFSLLLASFISGQVYRLTDSFHAIAWLAGGCAILSMLVLSRIPEPRKARLIQGNEM